MLNDLRTSRCHLNYAQIFFYPVDPIVQCCPDYFDVIKNPIDLSTIQKKMNNDSYLTHEDFAADIRLMINNCYIYNAPEHDIYKLCQKFQSVFENRYDAIINYKKKSELSPAEEMNSMGPKTLRPIVRPKYREVDEESLYNDEISVRKKIEETENLLVKLNAKLARLLKKKASKNGSNKKKAKTIDDEINNNKNNKKARYSDSDSEDDDIQPMSYDEKRILSTKINKLSSKLF